MIVRGMAQAVAFSWGEGGREGRGERMKRVLNEGDFSDGL